MPYIDDASKRAIEAGHPAQNAGELTYQLQQCLDKFLTNKIISGTGVLRFENFGACLLALEACKADFVDRVLLPYEATKAAENGDVWDTRLIATNR